MDVATLSLAVDSRPVKDATREMDTMSKAGGKLEGVVKGIAAAWASWKVVQYAREAATLAARYETLGVVMQVAGNNAGYTGAQMLELEKGLQKSGISMIASRDALTSMATANLDLAKSSQLARAAQDVAVVGNINSSEAFQNMVRGIKSGEVEILKTMGLNVQFEDGYKRLGAELHKNASALTTQEKLQSRMNQVLQESAKYTGIYEASMATAGKQLLSMQRYAEDLQVIFGAVFSDAFGVVVQTLNTALADTKKWLTENGEAAAIMKMNIGLAAQNFVGLVKDVMGTASGMASVKDELTAGEILAGGLALSMAVIRDAVMTVVGLGQKFSANMLAVPQAVGEAVRWVMGLFSIQPPQWLQKVIGLRDEQITKANKNMMGGAISQFYNGTPLNVADMDRDSNAAMAAAKTERDRINAANGAKRDAESMAKRTQATEAAIKAERKFAEVMRESNAATQALILQREIDAMWQGVESDRATQAAIELRELNQVMEEATEAIRKRDQAIQDAVRVTDQFLNPKDGFEKDKSRYDAMLKGGLISMETYKAAIKSIDPVWTDTFGSMARTLDDFSMRGTDAFVDFCFTGKAQFSDLITSMLRDLARLTVQKNVMGPLFDFLSAGISSWAGGGSTTATTTYNPGPVTTIPTGTSFTGMQAAPMSAPIIVNVSTDGPSKASSGNGDAAKLGQLIGAKVREVLVEESRQGGLMARA